MACLDNVICATPDGLSAKIAVIFGAASACGTPGQYTHRTSETSRVMSGMSLKSAFAGCSTGLLPGASKAHASVARPVSVIRAQADELQARKPF